MAAFLELKGVDIIHIIDVIAPTGGDLVASLGRPACRADWWLKQQIDPLSSLFKMST